MSYAVGIILALAVAVFARSTGFDRDRAFYPTVVVVIAAYYVLFAAMGGSTRTLIVESLFMSLFVIAAVVGFKRYPWLVAASLAAHGLFDVVHDLIVHNPGVPSWWPAFCLTFDVGAAAVLAVAQRRAAALRAAAS
jgi:hypothetical protein